MAPNYIPLDLQISTLLRLPVKSLLRFRCVSKLWSSIIITSRDFKNGHLDISVSSAPPPRLLIAFEYPGKEELMLVSLPNPEASSSFSSSCCVPFRDLSVDKIHMKKVYNAVRGMICVGSRLNVGICNPSTRQLYMFPQINYKDPVEDQYKVLAVDNWYWRGEHKAMVLGVDTVWRDAPCVACPHVAKTLGLSMKGTLYYGAVRTDINYPNNSIIVSFDVRLETFNIIKVPIKVLPMGGYENKTLINYRGEIGVVENPRGGSFRMWVVEDAEKEECSMETFCLPESAAGLDFKVMNTFCTGEICMVPKKLSDPFSLYYYNLERRSMRSITIEGLPTPQA